MIIKSKASTFRGLTSVKFIAIISKSVKNGIPRRFQKTFRLKTVAPTATLEQLRKPVEAEAKRWEHKIMEGIEMQKRFAVASEVVCEKGLL